MQPNTRATALLAAAVRVQAQSSWPASTARAWAWIIDAIVTEGRAEVRGDHTYLSQVFGCPDSQVRRTLNPLIEAGLISYTPGANKWKDQAARISTINLVPEALLAAAKVKPEPVTDEAKSRRRKKARITEAGKAMTRAQEEARARAATSVRPEASVETTSPLDALHPAVVADPWATVDEDEDEDTGESEPAVLPEEGIDLWTGEPISNETYEARIWRESREARHTPRGMQTGSMPPSWVEQHEQRIMRAVGLA